MEEPEETISKTVTLYKYHIEYLESFDKNTSLTLRDKLDKIIQIEKNNNRTKKINDYFIPVGLGTIILLFSFLMKSTILIIGVSGVGLFFIIFGTIGGIINEVQTTRRRR